MCAGWLCVCCAVVSVIWMCPDVWGERRLDLVVFCVWPSMFGTLVLLRIGVVCLVAWGLPLR